MARRRLARTIVGGVLSGLGEVGKVIASHRLHQQQQREAEGAQRANAALSLIPRVLSGELPPEALSGESREVLGGVLDLGALQAPARRMARFSQGIESAGSVTDLPTDAGMLSQLGALGFDTSPTLELQRRTPQEPGVLPSSHFAHVQRPDVARAFDQREQRRHDLLGEEARKRGLNLQAIDHVDASGRGVRSFHPETELAGQSFFTEPTAAQAGARRGAETIAELSDDVIGARARQAHAVARAQLLAQVETEAAQMGLSQQQQQAAFSLADDFYRESSNFYQIADSFRVIATVAGRPSPAGDLSLVFSFMRAVDPGSVVREGEFATAENSAGVPQQLRNFYNRLLTGERLSDEQRQDFAEQAGNLYEAAELEHRRRIDLYRRRAEQFGVPDFLVIREPDAALRPRSSLVTETGEPLYEILEVQ